MDDEAKTREQLIEELKMLRKRNLDLELLDAEHTRSAQKLLQESERKVKRIAEVVLELQNEITKRQQVEEELEKERRRLFSVLDGLPAQVYLIAPDYSFRFSNRFFQERFGNPEASPCYTVFHGRTEPCTDCETFVAGKPICVTQGEWSYPDGYNYEVYDYPFIDVDGSEMLLSFGFDITERKKMEEELKLSEERFSKAFNASPIAMTISTLETGEFIHVNDSFCRISKYERQDILGRTSMELGFWADPQDYAHIKHMITQKQPIREMELYFLRKTGEQGLALFTAERLDINGEACILGIITDITERKDMEIEMIRLDRLGLVGEMAASIGHEIRNPMTTVRGFLQILKDNPNYAQEKEYFDLMIEELDRANAIITEFLSLAKNKMVELKPLNLQSILTNILPLVQANAIVQDQNVRLEMQEVPDLLLDEKEIRQLILNLVHNALEAMSADRNVTIRTYTENEHVVLAIEDQGTGIDHDLLDKLGTPFFTTKEQGTGLGLAICYGIASRHQAKIDIETGSSGTTFFVKFPITSLCDDPQTTFQ
ncbi:MAG: ATP-binding protein [Syntrophomonadaceae bacterium]|nr:ATP-binding protein [Syntrophomonadaceae bacterium]